MSSNKNIERLYHDELKHKLKQLEQQRVFIIDKIKHFFTLSILPIIVAIILCIYFNTPIPFIITFGIAFIISFIKINPLWKKYHKEFKENVIREIIKFISDSLTYEPLAKISQREFEECEIFKTNIDRYRGDDYVEGTLESTHIKFSEIHAEYKTQTVNSKGRTQTHWHTIFKGLLFSADFNKNFNVKTFVLKDTAEKMFGFLGTKLQKLNKSRGELVKLENPEFESEFAVYSCDQIESRYLLSPALMDRILNFKNQANKNIQLSFVNSRLYVSVPYSRSLFEPKLFGDIVNFEHINEYYNDLNLVLDLIKTLNLNNRIWTKE